MIKTAVSAAALAEYFYMFYGDIKKHKYIYIIENLRIYYLVRNIEMNHLINHICW